MKRYNVKMTRRFGRFGLQHPHYLNRVTSFRGGVRL